MIDAHQHFWRIDRGDYGWLTPALGAIYRDFGPADLAPILARRAIDATILVQAAPTVARDAVAARARRGRRRSSRAWSAGRRSTRRMSRTASRRSRPSGDSSGCVRWCRTKPTTTGCSGPRFAPAFDAMIAHGLVFDALVLPRHLPRLARVLSGIRSCVSSSTMARNRASATATSRHGAPTMAGIAAHPQVSVQAFRPRHGSAGTMRTRTRCDPTSRRSSSSSGRDGCLGQRLAGRRPRRRLRPVARPRAGGAGGLDAAARADVFGGNAERVHRRHAVSVRAQ